MTGAIAMGTSKITGLGDPTAAQDAATKTYVDTADALKLNLTGGTMSGAIAMGTNKITGVGDPTLAQDAATKAYTDSILGSATSAADSAAAAATSASNAATSASNAATSATASADSATAAAASYDAFDDRYLGDKASDPTLDNDGNALLTGALYFNTTSDVMKVYDGSAWNIAAISSASPTFTGTVTADGLSISKDGTDHIEIIDTSSGQVTNLATGNTVGYISVDPSNTVATSKFAVYVDGTEYLEVSDTGIDVTGTVTADGLTVDGDSISFNTSAGSLDINPLGGGSVEFDSSGTFGLKVGGTSGFNVTDASDNDIFKAALNGDISFYEDTGTTPKFFWDASAERLGIRTTSPNVPLEVAGGGTTSEDVIHWSNSFGVNKGMLQLSSTGGGQLQLRDAGNNVDVQISSTADSYFNGGYVGIGTSSPASALHAKGGSTTTPADSSAFLTNATARLVVNHGNEYGAYVGYVNATNNAIGIQSARSSAQTGPLSLNPYGGNVGIGTTSPAAALEVVESGGSNTVARFNNTSAALSLIQFQDTGTTTRPRIGSAGNDLILDTANTERLRIDSSGNVGIGTSSPASPLHINTGANGNIIQANGSDVGWDFILKGTNDADTNSFLYEMGMYRADGTTNPNTVLKFGRGDNVQNGFFAIDQNGSEAMRIDASGNVGIGTNSPAADLHIANSVVPRIRLEDSGSGQYAQIFTNNDDLVIGSDEGNTGSLSSIAFRVDASEKMRIDSSGNLLVGTTTTLTAETNVEGISLAAGSYGGLLSVSRDSNRAATFNRKTSDGEIVQFRKDGTTVGSIGTFNSYLTIGNGDTGVLYNNVDNCIQPWDVATNTGETDAIDLGKSSGRFKNLYLSGGVYLGGTGAANLLDDYEEGTWTVNLYDALTGGNVSSSSVTGRYIKIGKQVIASFDALNDIDTTGMTAGNVLYISLPFSSSSTGRSVGICDLDNVTFPAGGTSLGTSVADSNGRAIIRLSGSNIADIALKIEDFDGTTSDITNWTLSYRTD
jgi:hypothetical protein